MRAIVISVDPDRWRSYDLTLDAVVSAIRDGNFISPLGNVYIRDEMPLVPNNAMISDPKDFGNITIKLVSVVESNVQGAKDEA